MGVKLEGQMRSSSLEHAGSSRAFETKERIERRFSGESPRDLEAKLNRGLIESAENQEVRNYFAKEGFAINSPEGLINATVASCLIENEHFLDGYTPSEDEFVNEKPDFILSFRSEEDQDPIDLAFRIVEGQPGVDQDLELKGKSEIEDCDGNKLTLFEIAISDHWQEVAILFAKKLRGEGRKGLEGVTIKDLRERVREDDDPPIENVVSHINRKMPH